MPGGVWENNLASADQNSKLMVALVHEWWPSSSHLVQENAQGPPVYREIVALHVEDFRCQIFSRTAEGMSLLFWCEELCQAEVGEADVAILIHQYILWLQIAVHDFVLVEIA